MQQRPAGYAGPDGARGQVQRRGLITQPWRGQAFGPAFANNTYTTDGTTWFNLNAPGVPDARYWTLAYRVKIANYAIQANNMFFGAANRRAIGTTTTGSVQLNLVLGASAAVMPVTGYDKAPNEWYTVHFSGTGDPAGIATGKMFINGVDTGEPFTTLASEVGTGNYLWTQATTVSLMGNNTGTSVWPPGSQFSFFYFDSGPTAASAVLDPAKFCTPTGGDVDLGPTGNLPTGTTPQVFLGGVQSLVGVNAGTNLGTLFPAFIRGGSALTSP